MISKKDSCDSHSGVFISFKSGSECPLCGTLKMIQDIRNDFKKIDSELLTKACSDVVKLRAQITSNWMKEFFE